MLRCKFVDLFAENNFVFERFFRISYNLTVKWNFYINFFQVLTNCEFTNFSLIKKCNQDN